MTVAVLAVTAFAGCGKQNESTEKADADDKISISMYMWDRSMFKELTPWLEQKFPDIENVTHCKNRCGLAKRGK